MLVICFYFTFFSFAVSPVKFPLLPISSGSFSASLSAPENQKLTSNLGDRDKYERWKKTYWNNLYISFFFIEILKECRRQIFEFLGRLLQLPIWGKNVWRFEGGSSFDKLKEKCHLSGRGRKYEYLLKLKISTECFLIKNLCVLMENCYENRRQCLYFAKKSVCERFATIFGQVDKKY